MAKEIRERSSVPTVLKVRKDGDRFIGDLHWSDGEVWTAWQSFKSLGTLVENARCTFIGPIVRV